MDIYSTDFYLINIRNSFHKGRYQDVVDFDTSSFSPENTLLARALKLRARIALGQAEAVLTEAKGQLEPGLQAIAGLAEHALGKTESAVQRIEKLASSAGDDAIVQVVGGIVLHAAGKSEEALSLLSQHQASLEAVSLIVQIHLQQNRTELAVKEFDAARSWAQDSLLVDLAEAWVGLRVGGEKYSQAFYVYEDLAQNPSTTSTRSLVSQAVCELHQHHFEEAQTTLEQALKKEPDCVEAIANMVVIKTVMGENSSELTEFLQRIDPNHQLLIDMEDKVALFDTVSTKYSARISS